jgi:hypothetical protein
MILRYNPAVPPQRNLKVNKVCCRECPGPCVPRDDFSQVIPVSRQVSESCVKAELINNHSFDESEKQEFNKV